MERITELKELLKELAPVCPFDEPDCQNCDSDSACKAASKSLSLLRGAMLPCFCGQVQVAERGGDLKGHLPECPIAKLHKNRRRLEDLLRKDLDLCAIFVRLAGLE